jgi:nucleotide-binding universal stress UspA family protein
MHVLALVDGGRLTAAVLAAARTVGGVLAMPVRAVHVGPVDDGIAVAAAAASVPLRFLDGEPVDILLTIVADDDVALVVLGARDRREDDRPAGHVAEALLTCIDKPVLVVGPRCVPAGLNRFERLLVPLDGSQTAATAVQDVADLFGSRGVDIVALHVFDTDTVPAFFDQPQHAYLEFIEAFLGRHRLHASARLALRSGDADRAVLNAIDAEAADVVAVGWAQRLQPGRARVIRSLLVDSPIPVLLLPNVGSASRARQVRTAVQS